MAAALVMAVPIQATTAGAEETAGLTFTIDVTVDDTDFEDDPACVDPFTAASWSPSWLGTPGHTPVLDGSTIYLVEESVSFEWADGMDECGEIIDADGSVSGVITLDGAASGWYTEFLCSADLCDVTKDDTTYSPATANVEIEVPSNAIAGRYTATVTLTWTP